MGGPLGLGPALNEPVTCRAHGEGEGANLPLALGQQFCLRTQFPELSGPGLSHTKSQLVPTEPLSRTGNGTQVTHLRALRTP